MTGFLDSLLGGLALGSVYALIALEIGRAHV